MLRIILIAALMTSPLPLAASGDFEKSTDSHSILTQQQQIRAAATAREGRFKDMASSRRDQLFAHQDTVTGLLQGTARTTDLPERDQLSVFNALEAIEAIVNEAEDDRMICERYRPTGSNRPTHVCKTVGQRRAEKQVADRNLDRTQGCADVEQPTFCQN